MGSQTHQRPRRKDKKKDGQHKLGLGGYSDLEARIVSIKKTILHQENKLQLIFHFIEM